MVLNSRTVVLVGGGRGSLATFSRILHALPADWPFPLLAAFHPVVGDVATLLGREARDAPITATRAVHHALPEAGSALVAPVDRTMRVAADGRVELDSVDPAHTVDALFTSAAAAYGRGVLAVLLGGAGKDGVAGMRAIHECGGRGLVEAPASAECAELPAQAIIHDSPAAILMADRIGPALLRWAGR